MKKILIVDDSAFMRSWLKRILSVNQEIVFVEADNGYSAIDTYKQHAPDLTLMDIVMPQLTGIEALKKIMKFDPQAKIIICSSIGQGETIKEAIHNGAKDFVVKPDFYNLRKIVKKYL